jgi:uncharacterized protein (TIGR03083 family)
VNGPAVDALSSQLDALIVLVRELSDVDFERPTRCPGWSVAELLAHCEGVLERLVGENAQPVDGEAEVDRVGYYCYDPDGPREGEDPNKTFSDVIRERVIDEVGGRHPGEHRASLEDAARSELDGIGVTPSGRVIKRSGHPQDDLRRVRRITQPRIRRHTMDIAHAVGRAESMQPEAVAIITGILDGLLGSSVPASLEWDTTTYILTGTGLRSLTPDERLELGALADRFPLLG